MIQKEKSIGYGMIFISGSLWGTIGLFVNLFNGLGAESSLIAFLRLFIGFLLLVPIMYIMGGRQIFLINKKSLLFCFLSGVFSQAGFNLCYTEAVGNVGVATASVLLYTAPIFVCIMSRIFFKETIGWKKLAALAVNIVGCTLTVTGGNFSTVQFSVYGVLIGVAAGFLYGLMTILAKKISDNCPPMTIVFYSFLFGWLTMGVFSHPWDSIGLMINWKFIIVSIAYGMIPTTGAYLLYMKGLSKGLEASKVPIIASVETVVAALIGFLLFREEVGIIKIIGIACVLFSIVIMNISKNRKDTPNLKETVKKGMIA
ncbi:DMT family transporter [Anaerovorax sp. IOR16]|uniref:DMT family transporter n=1 Tax=Anaerovorax sp. IOR16 TaxID=2773458 RepID=UPI0019D2D34C|nr:DMT family transporter [Anaerovorax sp. IOR16]